MDEAEQVARIEEIVLPIARDHGLELVDLEWRALRPRGVLRLYVDKPDGVGIADCERLSREVGDVLDAAGLPDAPYDLEVSSPGLDRHLRTERELRWAVGKRMRCWQAGGREVWGRLLAVEPGWLVLEGDGEEVRVERATVTKARLEAEVPWPRKA